MDRTLDPVIEFVGLELDDIAVSTELESLATGHGLAELGASGNDGSCSCCCPCCCCCC